MLRGCNYPYVMILEDPPHYNLVHHCTDAIGHLMCISVLPVALGEVFDGE